MTKTLIVTENFSAAHFYHQKAWSEAENQACFGKCFTEHGHGHNYRLEVGFLDPTTSSHELKTAVKAATDLLDHQHVNFTIPEFKTQNPLALIPTTENIAIYLLKKLQERSPEARISYIKLFETTDIWVEIRP